MSFPASLIAGPISSLNSIAAGILPATTRDARSQTYPIGPERRYIYLKQDQKDRKMPIRVYDDDGTLLYNITRDTWYTSIWRMYTAENNTPVASVHAGTLKWSVSFDKRPQLAFRKLETDRIIAPHALTFFLNDGPRYQWNYDTKYLEKTINPGGQHEEVHVRLAQALHLRPNVLDWLLIVDSSFDPEIAITTALAPMLSAWSMSPASPASGIRMGSPESTQLQQPLQQKDINPKYEETIPEGIDPKLLVYTKPERSMDFFNPPRYRQA